jgi:hypothetical protein
VVGEAHHARNQIPSETRRRLVIPERALFMSIAIVGAVGSGKTASCIYPFAEQILAYRDEDYCGADGGDPIYYARHTVMKAQAEERQNSGDKLANKPVKISERQLRKSRWDH